MSAAAQQGRLHGLDFARFLAFAGMVFVNFHVVMGLEIGADWAFIFLGAFEGKAAATFVVLAGLGLGLAAQRAEPATFRRITLKRALFLFVIGLINSLIFPADILHYYAVYFVFGLLLIQQSTRLILLVMLLLPSAFLVMLLTLNYDLGWNWVTFDYEGFWTPRGFVRNLFFNGWHPVVPWLSFLLFGFLLARLDLRSSKVRKSMMLFGALAVGLSYGLSGLWGSFVEGELAVLGQTKPVPPVPFYMLGGMGAASLVVGFSLVLFDLEKSAWLRPFTLAGRQALTLYIAHIIIGMGTLEELGMIGGQPAEAAVFAGCLFIVFSILYAMVWAKFFKVGPIEWVMRRVAG